jgi:hypothetical protein
LVETRDGCYVVEPAIYTRGSCVRHCIVAHRERNEGRGGLDVVELSGDLGSYPNLLRGLSQGFELRPQSPRDQARASAILRRLLDLRVAEIVP